MKRWIIFIIALSIMSPIFAEEQVTISAKSKDGEKTQSTNGFTDPNKAIQVRRSSPIIFLKLRSNPTTGYSWFLVQYDHHLIRPMVRKYVPAMSELVGASGYDVWEFSVKPDAFVVPQMTQVTLRYLRPWVVPTNGQRLSFTIMIEDTQ